MLPLNHMGRLRSACVVLSVILVAASAPRPAARAQAAQGIHRRALLVGVSKYSHGGSPTDEWWDLSSEGDVSALRGLLVDKFGFQNADIVTLSTRPQTTRASILAAFDQLIADTHKGDIVYIHYSGHGTPVPDKNGDEFDGLDESIVPSDYVSRRDGSRNIIDDTIGEMLAKLSAREPASVTLTFDSCFSGSQTRGGRMVVRGGGYLGVVPPGRPGMDPDVTGLGEREAFARRYVVISAARNDQPAHETDDGSGGTMGLLTYALVEHMRAAGPNTTYRDLFDGVFDTVARRNPGQTPQLEGDLDAQLMSGVALPPQPYLETRVDDLGRLILQAGSLHGITVGSQFALYPRGSKTFDGSGVIARAEVATVRATTAILKPAGNVDIERLRTARAVETAHKYGDTTLRMDVTAVDSLPRGAELGAEIQRAAAESGLIRPVRGGAWDLKVCGSPCPEATRTPGAFRGSADAIELIRHDGSRAAALPDSPGLPAALTRAIENEARWRMVAALDRRDPHIGVEVRLVPADVTLADDKKTVTSASLKTAPARAAGGLPTMAVGDYFMVEVRNTGSLDAYVTVLDLSPDGSIGPIWPHPRLGRQVQENKVKAAVDAQKAEWLLIPFPYVFRVSPPLGNEIIKAIATDVPADFSTLLTSPVSADSRGIAKGRGEVEAEKTPVGRLLASVTRGKTRGSQLAAEPPDPSMWSTGSFTFIISAGRGGRP